VTTAGGKRAGWWRQVMLILHKDLAVELRSGEVLTTSGLFAVLVVVVGSMAFYSGPQATVEIAPGVIWVAVSFATVLALARSWQREREHDAFGGLLCMPVARSAIFVGKALGLALFVGVLELLVIPLSALLLDVPLGRVGPGLGLLCLVATPGIAATGTLFGAMTLRTGARELVLAGVLFPLLAPTLLASVVATRELCAGASLAELGGHLGLVAFFDLLFVVGGIGLFGTLVDP
jgi:heme exporter protein B